MTCRELTELLMDYVAGELPPEQHGQVQDHLGQCTCCMSLVETYHLTIHICRKLPRPGLSPDCEERLRAALIQHDPPSPLQGNQGVYYA